MRSLLTFAALALTLVACGERQSQRIDSVMREELVQSSIPVETLVLESRDFDETFDAAGVVEADEVTEAFLAAYDPSDTGAVSRSTFLELAEAGAAVPAYSFAAADADSDGLLTPEEAALSLNALVRLASSSSFMVEGSLGSA